jgi:hypothetical protein
MENNDEIYCFGSIASRGKTPNLIKAMHEEDRVRNSKQKIERYIEKIKNWERGFDRMDDLGMTPEEIKEINKGIPFKDTKLYWKEDFGWSSLFWDKLYESGWRMVESEKEPGTFLMVNEDGVTVISATSKFSLFLLLTNYMAGGK